MLGINAYSCVFLGILTSNNIVDIIKNKFINLVIQLLNAHGLSFNVFSYDLSICIVLKKKKIHHYLCSGLYPCFILVVHVTNIKYIKKEKQYC